MNDKAVLIILDGFGIGKDSPFNAIDNAKMPFYQNLLKLYPHSELLTHGEAVGLPEGIMGNSEVGHMAMGSGRVIYQDLVRINKSIQDKNLFSNPVLLKAISSGQGRVHLMGLVSDGGVHSHIDHLLALLDLCASKDCHAFVHAFMDGRDTPPDSGCLYLEKLLAHPSFSAGKASLASMSGRFYAMDRDKRWERMQKFLNPLYGHSTTSEMTPEEYIKKSYENKITDEFIEPTRFSDEGSLRDGDSVICFNYRADRARQLCEKLKSSKEAKLSSLMGMTEYDKRLAIPSAFGPKELTNIMGEWLEARDVRQFRVAETEKYAHVTFFFNGGREDPFQGEERVLIPSPQDVETYDQKPEMSAPEVAQEAVKRIASNDYSFVLMNFANADMVGHTGNYEATRIAMECLDKCLSQVVSASQKGGYHVLITADHGNAEEMRDSQGRIHTQHTLNPVPALWVAPNSAIAPKSDRKALDNGSLADVMPTLCDMMKIPLPNEVTGKSLLPC